VHQEERRLEGERRKEAVLLLREQVLMAVEDRPPHLGQHYTLALEEVEALAAQEAVAGAEQDEEERREHLKAMVAALGAPPIPHAIRERLRPEDAGLHQGQHTVFTHGLVLACTDDQLTSVCV
jgi:hypothetical protein